MKKLLIITLLLLTVISTSCIAGQLKYDRIVEDHMKTLITTPDEAVTKAIEEWNARTDLSKNLKVDLKSIQENILSMEFDNKKGQCTVYYKRGLDFNSQRVLIGQCMVVYGSLYWQQPENKRDVVRLLGILEDTESFVFSWTKGKDKPEMDDDRTQNYV